MIDEVDLVRVFVEARRVSLIVWHGALPCFMNSAVRLSPIRSVTRKKLAF